jgi:hypothetical protein
MASSYPLKQCFIESIGILKRILLPWHSNFSYYFSKLHSSSFFGIWHKYCFNELHTNKPCVFLSNNGRGGGVSRGGVMGRCGDIGRGMGMGMSKPSASNQRELHPLHNDQGLTLLKKQIQGMAVRIEKLKKNP